MLEMKIARHAQIIKLINQYDIETQEELAKKLEESGFAVTQATISRDIRQLWPFQKKKKRRGGKAVMLFCRMHRLRWEAAMRAF